MPGSCLGLVSKSRGLECHWRRGVLTVLSTDSILVFFLCFIVLYFVSIVVLQSFSCGRESWLLGFVCLPGVS